MNKKWMSENRHAEHSDDDDKEISTAASSGRRKKSPERIAKEKQFMILYEELMRPTKALSARQEEYLLADLYSLLRYLNTGWAYRKAERYRKLFPNVDEDVALSIGIEYAHTQLIEDKINNVYYPYALAHYLRIAQNKAIDKYFRTEFGRIYKDKGTGEWTVSETTRKRSTQKQPPYVIYLEDMMTDADGTFHDDRNIAVSCDPFGDVRRPAWQRDTISQRIALAYLKCVLDYDDEPQKALALMYGSILFQIAREIESDDPLVVAAKQSKVLTSTKWAFLKMGDAELSELGDESEDVVTQYYGLRLYWGSFFRRKMREYPVHNSQQKWGDIVYTKNYSRDDTSNWIESIGDSMTIKAAHIVHESRELREYILDSLAPHNRLRIAMEKLRKETCR